MARMFVALTPPAEVLEHLEEFLDPRRDAGDFRWVQPDQIHLTLAFAPTVPDRALDDFMDRLARAASRRTAFDAAIGGGGAFPNVARARVIWAGLKLDGSGRTELDRLAAGCRAAAARAGIAVDGARFRPHLTLARTRYPHDVINWIRLLDTYSGPTWRVDEVSLISSHLGEGPRGRPRYEPIATLQLPAP